MPTLLTSSVNKASVNKATVKVWHDVNLNFSNRQKLAAQRTAYVSLGAYTAPAL